MGGFIKHKRGEGRDYPHLFKYMGNALNWVREALLDPYWLHLAYFVGISILGFLPLRLSQTKNQRYLNQLDAFYTSVSVVTVSSLGVVRMQEFSEEQLLVLTMLMLIGGEVFTSMLCLHLRRLSQHRSATSKTISVHAAYFAQSRVSLFQFNDHEFTEMDQSQDMSDSANNILEDNLEYRALTFLSYIALLYLVVVQLVGILVTILCFSFSPGREHILDSRDIKKSTFCVFTIVSSFANCGFIPLDDNMLLFRKDSVLLITVALQVLLGNTMYAPCLRALVWTLRLFSRSDGPNRRLYEYILKDGSMKLYEHLFPTSLSLWLVITVVGFFTVQLVITCVLQWWSEALDGLDTWEKLVAVGFQSVAIRHAGETVVSPDLLSPAIIILYIVMMYLPSYPVYFADRDGDVTKVKQQRNGYFCKEVQECRADERSKFVQLEKFLFHDTCYLIIAVIVICITERESISNDPLNYKVVNIVFEVVSAYGNVGMSVGYSCSLFRELILNSKGHCEEVPYSFSGKWSATGKVVIIMVMFFGRLKGVKRNRSIFLNTDDARL